MTLKPIVCKIVNNIIARSKDHSFRSEEEIQGYFVASLQYELEYSQGACVQEFPTKVKYRRANGLLEPCERGRSGMIDIVVINSGQNVGIELEYPRGTGLEMQNFKAHIKNDLLKLDNEDSLDERYLSIMSYNDPPMDVEQCLNESMERVRDINIAYIRLAKKSENGRVEPKMREILIPGNWLARVN